MIRFLLAFLVLSFVIGCLTENPLCTDNYCITGEVFSKDELAAGQTFEVLPLDETAIVAAIDAATLPDGDVTRHPKVSKATPEEWKTLIDKQGNIPVLELITVTDTFRIQVADQTPKFCVSLTNEIIDDVSYTAHRSTWVRIVRLVVPLGQLGRPEITTSINVIDSSIADGKICGMDATEIRANDEVNLNNPTAPRTSYTHRLIVDMTVNGERLLYVSPSTFSKN